MIAILGGLRANTPSGDRVRGLARSVAGDPRAIAQQVTGLAGPTR